jgi:phosphoribosylcarboxyaminoimidazole (NCAIR) mutase
MMISPTVGLAARIAGSLESNSLSPVTALRTSAAALGSTARLMPTLQPPGNMAVMVNAPVTGLKSFEDVLEVAGGAA